MKQIKNVFTIIATLIGAGFASGQEIYSFFYLYGMNGIYGLFLCSLLFVLIIYLVLYISLKNNIFCYNKFVNYLFNKYGCLINILVNIFLLVTFFIMISGFGAYFSQENKVSTYIGSSILAILSFFTILTKNKGVIKINSWIVPILIFFIVIISIINSFSIDSHTIFSLFQNSKHGWISDSILYFSYNSILLIPILFTFNKKVNTKTDILLISTLSGTILLILSISIFLLLTKVSINNIELPVLYVIKHFYKSFRQLYAFIILASIYTTAVSIGISFLDNIQINKNYDYLFTFVICIFGLLISGFGFSNLVTKLYPIFGYLGLIQIFTIINKGFKIKRT